MKKCPKLIAKNVICKIVQIYVIAGFTVRLCVVVIGSVQLSILLEHSRL